MAVKKSIFRYRVITNLNCNMNESTGPHGNCYFCYQPLKEPLQLDMAKAISTMDKVGILKRATIMGGESTIRKDLPEVVEKHKMVKCGLFLDPVKQDIVSYYVLRNRKCGNAKNNEIYRNLDLFKCFIKYND